MMRKLLASFLVTFFLSSCAHQRLVDGADETVQSIDDALMEASVEPVEPIKPPADDILDELSPELGVSIPGLAEEIRQEQVFDISVSKAPARLFFMSLVKDTAFNMVVHPSVDGEISLVLKNVTVPDVMDLVREVYGYEYSETESGFIVLPARIQSRIFQVNYLNVARQGSSEMTVNSGGIAGETIDSDDDNSSSSNNTATSSNISTTVATDFWSGLEATISSIVGEGDGRSIVIDRHAGLVVVRAMPGELRDVEAYLDSAQDNLQRQVILEAKVIEVELSDSFQSGIDWAAIASSRDFTISNSGVIGGVAGSSVIDSADNVSITSPLDVTGTTFGNLFAVGGSSETFGALITLLNTQGNAKVLSSPRVSTVNNQKAVIKVGTDEFYVTDVSSPTTSSSSSSSTTTTQDLSLSPFFSGISLDVTPQISEEGEVILHIHPSVSEISDQTKTIIVGGQTFQLPLASSTVRESDSVIKASNGQVVVIGGLMKNSLSDEEVSVSGAADLPVIGSLFKQTRKVNRRSELVILLRPIVVGEQKTWSNYIRQSKDRIRNLNDADIVEASADDQGE